MVRRAPSGCILPCAFAEVSATSLQKTWRSRWSCRSATTSIGRISLKVLAFCSRSRGEPRVEVQRIAPACSPGASLSSAPVPSRSEHALRLAEWLVLAGGIVLFCVLLAQLGIGNVLANLQMVGWGIVLIIAAELVPVALNTVGWGAAFSRGRVPSFWQLLQARVAGDAVNCLTPTATLGGEFVRVRILQGKRTGPSLVASVMVAKITQTVGLVSFVAIGLLFVADDTQLPADARLGIFAGLAAFSVIVAGLLIVQRRGLLAPTLRLVDRWRVLRFLASLRSSIEQVDAEMTRVHCESTGRIVFSSASFALGYASGIIETYLILWFFGVPVSLELALTIEVLGVVLNNLMFFVPLRAGIQEAGKVLVFAMLGLEPAQGLAAGVIYRIRELTWAFIGLAIMARSRLRS
jgi:glycosyltransferase 2 family protein